MRVAVVTSLRRGVGSLALPLLASKHDLAAVLYVSNLGGKRSTVSRRAKKIRKIGILGALNGIRIRKWFLSEPAANLNIPDIETVAAAHRIPFVTVEHINSDEAQNALRDMNLDLGLSLGNSFIAERIFSLPKHGMINCHHELLPEYQGAQSVIWQIYDMKSVTGFTIHRVSRRIDGGDILLRLEMPIRFNSRLHDTVVETLSAVYAESVFGVMQVVDRFHELIETAVKQQPGRSYTTPSLRQFLRMQGNNNAMFKRKAAASNPSSSSI